jgi:choline dehydrogenase-like flavoprotein
MPDIDYDVLIVGCGVSGALIAEQLAGTARVALLDAGDRVPDEVGDRQALVTAYAMSSEKSSDSPYANTTKAPGPVPRLVNYYVQQNPDEMKTNVFSSTYLRFVGGASWHWQGIAVRMVPNDFRLASVYGRTDAGDWPLSYDDLRRDYLEAERQLGVAGSADEWNALPFIAGTSAVRGVDEEYPMPSVKRSYLDRQIAAAIDGETFDGVRLRVTSIPQARNTIPGYDGRPICDGQGTCIPLCPTKAKYEAIFHIRKAEARGVKVLPGHVVVRLERGADGGIASCVCRKRADGTLSPELSLKARRYVLAANAIEIPRLLLLSAFSDSDGPVGRYLLDHPVIMSYALAKQPVYPFRGPPSTSHIETPRDGAFRRTRAAFKMSIRNDGWSWPTGAPRGTYASGRGTILDLVGNQRLFGRNLRDEATRMLLRQVTLNSACEMLPSRDNRVTLAAESPDPDGIPRPRLQFKLDQYALDGLSAAVRLHKLVFERLGVIGQPQLQADGPYWGSGHPMGTTRMGTSPGDSVVDPSGRAHMARNLYIAGSSVFPTAAVANPTLTIAALALRTAREIASDLQSN